MTSVLFDECVDRFLTVPAFAPHAAIVFSRDIAPAAPDEEVLALARERGIVLVTEDTDFGRLVFRLGLPPPPGIILIALAPLSSADRKERLRRVAPEALGRAHGGFLTMGPTRLRRRPLLSTL